MNSKMLPSTTLLPLNKPCIKLYPKSFALKTPRSFKMTPLASYIPDKLADDSYVRIFDTTLRDGEQAPGATMTSHQKLEIARQLANLGVDVIEAGCPVSSKAEFETMKLIAKEVGNCTAGESGRIPVVGALVRLLQRDIDRSWEAVRHAKYPRMTVFIPTSEIHMKYKLKKTKDQVLRIVQDMVKYTKSLGVLDLGFGAEDAARSEKEFLYEVYSEAIKAGATTITFSDTVGCQLPEEWGQFITDMKTNIIGAENVIISTHCHNDLGLATANTLAAIKAGARQVDVTVNGIGERAGNAPLEEVVMAIKTRGEDFGGIYTGIDPKQIVTTSNLVEKYSGLLMQPHKPIVGANCFIHGSGIHQDGMLKNKSTYQFISPEDIGLVRSTNNENGIVLGKLSGRAAVKSRLLELGHEFGEEKFDEIFHRFKKMAENKKLISDDDLALLACDDGGLKELVTNGVALRQNLA